jgi:hypothetical protein
MQLKELITEAIEITGLKTEEEVLELGLKIEKVEHFFDTGNFLEKLTSNKHSS